MVFMRPWLRTRVEWAHTAPPPQIPSHPFCPLSQDVWGQLVSEPATPLYTISELPYVGGILSWPLRTMFYNFVPSVQYREAGTESWSHLLTCTPWRGTCSKAWLSHTMRNTPELYFCYPSCSFLVQQLSRSLPLISASFRSDSWTSL